MRCYRIYKAKLGKRVSHLLIVASIFERAKNLILHFFQLVREGILFIGEPRDMLFAVIDIIVTTVFFYFILKLLRDSRAWQLLKGIILILLLAMVSRLFGLNTISFLLNNTIQVFAIAFVVIFQPELRRALETMGRSSLMSLPQNITADKVANNNGDPIIEAICQACEAMAATRTGALIIMERMTQLGDLLEQANAFKLDAPVSATMLKQIFYVGTPLHDGAILIRDNLIKAARIHIPLSDSTKVRTDFGTRHRAAIGASELGDAVVIVISEEKGTISLAQEGKLQVLSGAPELKSRLYNLFTSNDDKAKHWWQRLLPQINQLRPGYLSANLRRQRKGGIAVLSLVLAVALWAFVQVQVNPLETRTYQLTLHYYNEEALSEKKLEAVYPVQDISVRLTGRKNVIDDLSSDDVIAYVDLAEIESAGAHNVAVKIDKKIPQYARTEYLSPQDVMILVRPYDIAVKDNKSNTSSAEELVEPTTTATEANGR